MRWIVLGIVTLFLLVAGCTSPLPSFKQTLDIRQPYVGQASYYSFNATITQLSVQNNGTVINFAIAIQNNGQELRVAVLPELVDPINQEFTAKQDFYVQIENGHTVTESGTISLPQGEYDTLKQNAVFHVRFQTPSPTPLDAYWAIDFTNLPR